MFNLFAMNTDSIIILLMKKNSTNHKIFCLILCFSFQTFLHAVSPGFEKCSALFGSLSESDVSLSAQNLVFNENGRMPFNIIGTFSANSEKMSKETGKNRTGLEELYIVLNAEDFSGRPALVKNLCGKIKDAEKSFDVSLVFTYGDRFSDSNPGSITGTEHFVSNIAETQGRAAVVLALSSENSIIPGGKKNVSPSYLVKAAADSFFQNGTDYSVKAGLLGFLYRLGFLETDEKTDFFFDAEIPSVAVNFFSGGKNPDENITGTAESDKAENLEKLPGFLESLIENIEKNGNIKNDIHSNHIVAGNRIFSTSETFTVILFLLFVFLSLFVLCGFSFAEKKTGEKLTKDVAKLWYVIPLSVLTTLAALFASQLLAEGLEKIFRFNVYLKIAVKFVIGFILSSFAFFITLKTQGVLFFKAYSFLLTVCGILNLVFFTAIDISLFYLFALEYALIFITRPEKRTATLSTSFFILLLPFVPYAVQIIKFTEAGSIQTLSSSPLLVNLVITLILLPFEIMWLRILVRLNQKWSKASGSARRFYIQNTVWISLAFALCIAVVLAAESFIPERYKKQEREAKTVFTGERDFIEIHCEDMAFFGENARIVTVRTKEPCETLTVRIVPEKSGDGNLESLNPVLYSDNDYVHDKISSADYFRIPVFPPEEMTFRYIANPNLDSVVKVSASKPENGSEIPGEKPYIYYENELHLKAKSR